MVQAVSEYQTVLRYFRKRCENPILDSCFGLRSGCDRQKIASIRSFSLHFITDSLSHFVRKNPAITGFVGHRLQTGGTHAGEPI